MGQAVESSIKECYLVNMGDMDSKVCSLSLGLKTAVCKNRFNLLALELFFLILAHPVYKM